ncbi:hypothetical protein, partial [Holdemania filiformis]|uniref:hypothetical protein n=1 Tax=Holdemania filiformis TaxID=61171 RepID=UPI00242BF9B5
MIEDFFLQAYCVSRGSPSSFCLEFQLSPLEAALFGQIEEPRFYLILISHSATPDHKRSGQMH